VWGLEKIRLRVLGSCRRLDPVIGQNRPKRAA
jgi:hypothetical protein